MRRFLYAGLCLAPLAGLALASELTGQPASGPQPRPAVAPAEPAKPAQPAKSEEAGVCHSHGTSVDFVDTPSEAARLAKKEGKLVFVLHISGYFEDPRFT
jgi:hypothetical protein